VPEVTIVGTCLCIWDLGKAKEWEDGVLDCCFAGCSKSVLLCESETESGASE